MKFRSEILFTLLLVGFFAFFIWEAREWRPQARLYPWAIGLPMVVLALFELVAQLRGKSTSQASGDTPVDFQFTQDVDRSVARYRTLQIFSWVFGFLLAVWLLGFHIAVPLVVFSYLKLQSGEKWVVSLACTAGAGILFWGLFDRFLHLPFPQGQLQFWLGP